MTEGGDQIDARVVEIKEEGLTMLIARRASLLTFALEVRVKSFVDTLTFCVDSSKVIANLL